jgi:hypothetical protein
MIEFIKKVHQEIKDIIGDGLTGQSISQVEVRLIMLVLDLEDVIKKNEGAKK